ncbi:MAG: polysaccharide deacetylase family protein [Neomegalonema sp.]|nr:polysaccharide deacetylase family protein [Neomegalonema sp.]
MTVPARLRVDFAPLIAELTRLKAPLPLWWRDDDAVRPGPKLARLLDLSRAFGAPLSLAVIPARMQPSLAPFLSEQTHLQVLVHGWRHVSHAGIGAPNAEFGAQRALEVMAGEVVLGLEHLRNAMGAAVAPVFVPPWHRMTPALLPHLATGGYRAVSGFGARAPGGPAMREADALAQINTHFDPIDWRRGGGLEDPAALVEALRWLLEQRRLGRHDPSEPLGLLTHHAVHDREIWAFLEALLSIFRESGKTTWVAPTRA